MKIFLLILFLPLYSIAQNQPNQKLHFRSTVVTDSGTLRGYFLYSSDSVIILSPQQNYFYNTPTTVIPVSSIQKIKVKNKGEFRILETFAASVIGFTLTAGLIQNDDLDNDGKTSFFELVWGAIEGTTSKNRRRRNTALIVGAAGGTTFMIASILSSRRLSLVFPINGRNNYYAEKRYDLEKFVKF